MEACEAIRNRIKNEKLRQEYDRFLELVRQGKMDHLDRETQRTYVRERFGVHVSERHYRRVVNRTPN